MVKNNPTNMKCPICGRFIKHEDFDNLHGFCGRCDMHWCFDRSCHCTEVENV